LESMRLGFSSSVLSRGTSCASFRFAAKTGWKDDTSMCSSSIFST
jgi:hypothetical protein